MDFPEAATTSPSDSVALPDSSIFGYISNLSPLKPVKAAHVVPGFPGLSSPPIVFTSPHPNPSHDSTYLKRSQCPQLSNVEIRQLDVGGKKIEIDSDEHEESKGQSSTSIPCIEKKCDNKDSVQGQAASPSRRIDENLPDTVEVDCENSTHLASLSSVQSDIPKSLNDCTDTNDTRQDAEKAMSGLPAKLELSGKDFQGKSSLSDKEVETDAKQEGSEIPSIACPIVESGSSVDHTFEEQHCELSVAQVIQGYEDRGETTRETSNEPVENMVLHDAKGQCHRGMSRRCLQFEEAQQNIITTSPGSWSPSIDATSSRLPASPPDFAVIESYSQDLSATSSGRRLVNLNQSMISKPSGIGLHLNSIVNPISMGCGAIASTKLIGKSCQNVQGRKLVFINGCPQPENVKNGSSDPELLKQSEYWTTSHNKRKSISEHVEELNQSSPKRKRRKASATNDGDGCKRCNCKKTKCLKLYCDCFAAGIYCDEPCTCQGCFNRPEYEDTVLETRQQIESRNPLAFAPKIVKRLAGFPANNNEEDKSNSTPSSARHKKGCNCKKSMCLKKYCECYQANVGCSSGCRCEGCKNVYGKKEEYGITEDVLSRGPIDKRFQYPFEEEQKKVASQDSLLPTKLCNQQNLTPPTPSFQFSDHGKGTSESQFFTRRCLPSPESDLTFLPNSPGSPGTFDNHDMLLKTRKDILGINSCHDKFDCSNVETVDEFSPSYDGLDNVFDLSPRPNPPSIANVCSSSLIKSDWTTISRAQLYPGSGHLSSMSSLRWRSSPITPVAQLGGTKLLQAVDSEEKLHDILEDGDTPEILKDTLTPNNAVKFSSPNKKRVSPPRSRLHELGSSSSIGLKSGRKFILRAVPSFPPLTPCIDSKDSSTQNINES